MTITLLDAPARTHAYDFREHHGLLADFAEGIDPAPVVGVERLTAAHRLHAWLSEIAPSPGDRATGGLNGIHDRFILAYDRGRAFLACEYPELVHLHLPGCRDEKSDR
ncbi:hypothetical protein LG293_17400 (plasmid) [Citricoccus nitrophenolicus]